MSEKNSQKMRFQLLELFPNALGDVTVRVGTVSRNIKYDKPPIHPIYGLAWYGLVEELFIHNQTDQLQNMISFLTSLNNLREKLHSSQQAQITSTIQWLQDLVSVCLNQQFIDQKSFNSIYTTLFYTRVFKEYADEQPQLSYPNQQPFYMEDAMSLVSSFFIMKELSWRLQNCQIKEKNQLHLYFIQLMGDANFQQNDQYLASIDKNRVGALSFFYNLSLRVYQEINGEIQTFAKINNSSQDKMNIGLGFIFSFEGSYYIAYDSTLDAQYSMFSHYKQKKNRVAENYYKLTLEIAEEKKKIYQQQIHDREELQAQFNKLQKQLEENKKESQLQQKSKKDKQLQCDLEENKTSDLLISLEQLQQKYEKDKIMKINKNLATQSYYSKENNFIIQFKNELLLKRLADQKQKELLEKQQNDYLESVNKNKNSIEETNFNNFNGKYAQMKANNYTKCVIANVEKKKECELCNYDKKISEIIVMTCCGYNICTECMKQTFQSNLKTLESLKCVNQKCRKPFRDLVPFYQQGLLSDKDLQKLTEKVTFICPNCQLNFSLKDSENKGSKLGSNLKAPCCGTEICRHCLQLKHKAGEVCKTRVDSYLQSIRAVIQSINQKIQALPMNPLNLSEKDLNLEKESLVSQKRFRFCPNCEILLLKDEQCEKMDCPQCKLQLCFTCVAPRQPTMDHDNSYHREGCKYYTPDNPRDPRKMNQKCVSCQKKGSVCDFPASWTDYQQLVRNWYGDAFFIEEFASNWKIS